MPSQARAEIEGYIALARTYEPADARYLENHRGHLMFLKPAERRFVSADMIRATSFTATEPEIKQRIAALRDAGYTQFTVQIGPGQEEALGPYRIALAMPVPGLKMNIGELVEKLDTRAMVAMRMDGSKRLTVPGSPIDFPAMQIMIAIDDVEFAIKLPEGLHFVSEGRELPDREFRWHGRLDQGSNPIPIAVRGRRAGHYTLVAHAIGRDVSAEHKVVLEVRS